MRKESAEGIRCPLCSERVNGGLRAHMVGAHGEAEFRKAVLADKARGMPDAEIGARYGISFGTLEQIVTAAYGANVSVLKRPKRIRRWEPPNFREETTSVWSFKQRGDWATHDGRYRGNWSPYIPRNVILKYSKPGDVVLDYFVGGGTTAIEAKLLGRRCIARDINPGAVGITLENLKFTPPRLLLGDGPLPVYEPDVRVGDARDLSDIPAGSVDLICAHPPYAGIIKYSARIAGDLSELSVPDFLTEMRTVAAESWRVLKPGGKCAILIGDARRSKRVVPIGFETIRVFLEAGFVLRELVIKRQHNCKTTGFWYARSIQHNFLLLAHEYLPIFEKPPSGQAVREQRALWQCPFPHQVSLERVWHVQKENLETTTVWIFPKDRLEQEVKRNLLQRFADPDANVAEVKWDGGNGIARFDQPVQLIHVRWPQHREMSEQVFMGYRGMVERVIEQSGGRLSPGGFLALEAMDFRSGGRLWPAGLMVYEDLEAHPDFSLREIVIVVPEERPQSDPDADLEIVHRYLLIYTRK